MPAFTDQTGRKVIIEKNPQRIISLVPSQTELLFDLGLQNEVIGITKFCVHPEAWFRSKKRVGGTKQVKIEIMDELQPDLVLANKEENVKEQVDAIAAKYPTWISDIKNLEDACDMITQVGSITGKETRAGSIIGKIRSEFSKLKAEDLKPRTCYLIWRNPYMTVGSDTFIHSMLEAAGFENILKEKQRYPEISTEELQSLNPELILLSSEPFPFKEKHIEELQPHFPKANIILADGEMFSWYGSRLTSAPEYFMQLKQSIIMK